MISNKFFSYFNCYSLEFNKTALNNFIGTRHNSNFIFFLRCSEPVKYITQQWKILQEDNNRNAQVTIIIYVIIWTVHILYKLIINFRVKAVVHKRNCDGSSERWEKYTDTLSLWKLSKRCVCRFTGRGQHTDRTLWAFSRCTLAQTQNYYQTGNSPN